MSQVQEERTQAPDPPGETLPSGKARASKKNLIVAVAVGLLVLAGLLFVGPSGGGGPTTIAKVPEGTVEMSMESVNGSHRYWVTAQLEDGTNVDVLYSEDSSIAGHEVAEMYDMGVLGGSGYIEIEQEDGEWVFVGPADAPAP